MSPDDIKAGDYIAVATRKHECLGRSWSGTLFRVLAVDLPDIAALALNFHGLTVSLSIHDYEFRRCSPEYVAALTSTLVALQPTPHAAEQARAEAVPSLSAGVPKAEPGEA